MRLHALVLGCALIGPLLLAMGCARDERSAPDDSPAVSPADQAAALAASNAMQEAASVIDPRLEVAFEKPEAGFSLNRDAPLLCRMRLKLTQPDRYKEWRLVLETCHWIRGQYAIMGTEVVPLKRESDGTIIAEVELEPKKLPSQPGKYAFKAVLVPGAELGSAESPYLKFEVVKPEKGR